MTIHSVFSMSGSHVWFDGRCPASIRMSRGYPNEGNDASELGTAAHELGEFCVRYNTPPADCKGMVFYNHVVDDDMINAVELYYNTLRGLQSKYGAAPLLEQRVTLTSLGRNDVFGTCDAIFILGQILIIRDYKHGLGPVEVVDNTQLIGYAIGALDTYNLWGQIKTVDIGLVQPRAMHINGPVRNWVYTIEDMQKWQMRYMTSVEQADSPHTKPNAGPWCTHCRARANCRARMERTLQLAYLDCPADEVSVGELEVFLNELKPIYTMLEEMERRAAREIQNGAVFENFKVVNDYGRRKCQDEAAFIKAAKEAGKTDDDLYQQKLKPISKLEKSVGKPLVGEHFKTNDPKPKVVPLSDRRPALQRGKVPKGTFSTVDSNINKE